MKPFPSSIKKIAALGLILIGLTLPACNASWIADTLSRYVQRKTGLDIQIKEVDWNLWSLAVNLKHITLGVEQKTAKGRVVIPDLSLRFGWEFSEAPPFAPRFWVERMVIDSPQISLRWYKVRRKVGLAELAEKDTGHPAIGNPESIRTVGTGRGADSIPPRDPPFRGLPARSRRSGGFPLPEHGGRFRHSAAVL